MDKPKSSDGDTFNFTISRGGDQVGGDKTTTGDLAGAGMAVGRAAAANVQQDKTEPTRRRPMDDDLHVAVNDLRNRMYELYAEVRAMKVEMVHLNERLRQGASFGTLQWWIITIAISASTAAAGFMLAGR